MIKMFLMLAVVASVMVGMTATTYATNTFAVPEHVGAQEWTYDERTQEYANAGGDKIRFTTESFVPEKGIVDSVSFIAPESNTQYVRFGIDSAFVIVYQNTAIAVVDERWKGFALVEPGQQYSIEFEGDTVRFHYIDSVFYEGKHTTASEKAVPFLKCSTDEPCGKGLVRTTNPF